MSQQTGNYELTRDLFLTMTFMLMALPVNQVSLAYYQAQPVFEMMTRCLDSSRLISSSQETFVLVLLSEM